MTAQAYTGGCQCGAVRYEVTADLDHTISCNCSRCGRLGSILAFTPASAFKLLDDPGACDRIGPTAKPLVQRLIGMGGGTTPLTQSQ